MDERKRDSIITYLRHRMAEFGITAADLAEAMAKDRMQGGVIRYRSATGDSWDGEGAPPQWLSQAIAAGQSIEHFAVGAALNNRKPLSQKAARIPDPFAGTRLAADRDGRELPHQLLGIDGHGGESDDDQFVA